MKRGVTCALIVFVLLSSFFLIGNHRAKASETTLLKVTNPLSGNEWLNFTTLGKKIGDTFSVNLDIVNVNDATGWQFSLLWNSSLMTCVHADLLLPPDVPPILIEPPIEPSGPDVSVPGRLLWGCGLPPSVTANGSWTMAFLEFQIIAPTGSCLFTFDPTETFLVDNNGRDVPFLTTEGHYNLMPPLSADLNADGRVDMRDVALAVAAFGSVPDSPRWYPNADLDGSGRIDLRDIGAVIFMLTRN